MSGSKFLKLLVGLLAALGAIAGSPASAWNARGHMIVAAIAWERMTPGARAAASRLLALNPQHGGWAVGIPAGERDRIAFMEAATWADDIRGMACTGRPECYRDEGYTPADAGQDLNIGFADRRVRPYWHFKNLAFTTDGTPMRTPFAPNAETQIIAFSQSLSNATLGDEAKSYNLTWLLHLVGDVHQPLHATARFSQGNPNGDSGGNRQIVCRPPPAKCDTERRPDKLHGLWDQALGTGPSPTAARAKALKLVQQADQPGSFLATVVERTDLDADVPQWMMESLELAKKYAYAPPIGDGRGPFFPTPAYRAAAGSIAEQQVVIAGERLARMLNAAFP
ncbi:S1/P1 nuclease [Sphingomonas sp.]|jgi:hypothetical protein|uniref:S1/P1 nuclease n=1 Tax=Sphingomonas sp. TaxID=28214 RepID=UPI002DE53548|nr:S1/P1 nuclease [Sphingomonas sp.]